MKAIRTILACIRKADQTFNLVEDDDKIIIGLSGGKDSVLLTYCLHLYTMFSHKHFTIQPVMLDLGFPGFDPSAMEKFCESIGLKLIVKDSKEVYKILVANQKEDKHLPCSICSRMKKAAINKVANELGYNKVAFAHHADDAIETYVMNAIYGARIATFAPKMHLDNANITFIRPLIFVRETDIIRTIKEEKLVVSSSHCPADKTTRREDIKEILNDVFHRYPESKDNFLTMLTNYDHEDVWFKQVELQVNSQGLVLKPVTTPEEMFEVLRIRNEVFIKEQNISIDLEVIEDNFEGTHHFLIKLKDKIIGTIRYRVTKEDEIKLERFALLKEYRGKGYGKDIFVYISEYLYKLYNPRKIYMHAMAYLRGFYEAIGYEVEGEIFKEAGIDHYTMVYKK